MLSSQGTSESNTDNFNLHTNNTKIEGDESADFISVDPSGDRPQSTGSLLEFITAHTLITYFIKHQDRHVHMLLALTTCSCDDALGKLFIPIVFVYTLSTGFPRCGELR